MVTSATATVAPRGNVAPGAALALGAPQVAGASVRVEASGGTDGESYLITVDAAGSDGGTYEAEAEVRVVDLTWAAVDGAGGYVTIAQFVDRFGLDETIRMTDTLGTGRVDKARLSDALVDASAIADGYIAAGGLAVPLPTTPAIVATAVLDLAVARLFGAAVPDAIATRATAAEARLKGVAAGTIKLPGADLAAATPASATPVVFTGPDRLFGRDALVAF